MGLKDLIFESSGEKKKPETSKKETISFPKEHATPVSDEMGQFKIGVDPITSDKGSLGWNSTPEMSCEPYMNSVLELYNKGFDSLNKEGYDFYEFYKAMLAAGPDNAAMYAMALNMAKAMDSSVTKENLLRQSEYYLTEISKVHKNYEDQGKAKANNILSQKTTEEGTLNRELSEVQSQLEQLRQKENNIKIQIGAIDSKYSAQLSEINCKIEANNVAKKELFDSINKVKQGINTNL